MLPRIQQLFLLLLGVSGAICLENGLARTPPMGWMSWERFRCNTDCMAYPDECISDKLFREIADAMSSDGYADVGYEYLIIDDCWLAHNRDANGKLQPDASRFPNGMLDLSDYIHSKGLKFGLYEDYGNFTCAGYPGIIGHMEDDANTFASWGVDYVKLDGCYAHLHDMDIGYPAFGDYLNRTGRPMVYSCSWPVYQEFNGIKPDYEAIIKTCNLWRNYGDIQDSWNDVLSIIDYYASKQDEIIPHAGPGHWNDPDMLIIGNYGLSKDQSKAQMALWSVMASPLIMSNDLRSIGAEFKAILQNKKVIAVNQDPLGMQGRRVYQSDSVEVWTRPITPVQDGQYSYAVVVLNRRTDGTPYRFSQSLQKLGLTNPAGYAFEELFDGVTHGELLPSDNLDVRVNPSGVKMFRAELKAKAEDTNHRPLIFPVGY
ncbi:alpha-N-acetylgalactosaminidase-like isoform X2 [Ischnura elegans]|uniref:alpha-N-acetylgalactosaminidase-like isoform X2 n=1 Tax=Ischnura elegans TaxID=197161 RepID=UPI001ED89FB7|nr:alpha-N-acetylgalactosaminidase-like isoform X2 [Ischnura elegans]XP_046394904.1 alpha-N-acetylgalactosaminidase-like isoform X2 [Ischnura elegans]